MKEIIQSSLSNMAIILFMHLCLIVLLENKRELPGYLFKVVSIALTSVIVISLFYLPIKYAGYQFDLRLIPLVFFSLRWGWKYAIPALFLAVSWRLGMGGDGAVPGVLFGMIAPVMITLLFFHHKKKLPQPLSLFILLFMCWFISDIPIIKLVPDGWNVFKEIFIIRIISIMGTGYILYFFIHDASKQMQLKEQLQFYAERDPLTGLYNMRSFRDKVKLFTISEKKRYIVMIDIDHFKSINDTYGHLNGDEILQKVAQTILEHVFMNGVSCILGRYGGEEFILFIAANTADELYETVRSIRMGIESTSYSIENKRQKIHLTVSIGVSEFNDTMILDQAIEKADELLYTSKRNGRNQISYTFDLNKRAHS